jgi:hypothetical protein
MARFLSLSLRAAGCLGAAGLGWIGCLSTPGFAQTPPAPAKTTTPAKPAPKISAPTPAQQAADALNPYGNIVSPGDEAAHPVRLHLPFPGVGEVKIPTQGELTMREKLEQLAGLSDTEIHVRLSKWPAYSKMTLRDQASMLSRIQDFRDYRSKIAMQKAHDMGLLTLTDDQKKKFEKDYWDKQLQMDRELAKQFDPIYQAEEQKFKDELFREFSAASGVPLAQGAKPAVLPATNSTTSSAASTPPAKNASTNGAAPGPMAQH